ncbi:MAG: SUMF1/EgtB/PvdO family nonheme iron enzyme [Planctomycetota bacterium]
MNRPSFPAATKCEQSARRHIRAFRFFGISGVAVLSCLAAFFWPGGLLAATPSVEPDPAFYHKQASWEETLRLSIEALVLAEQDAARKRDEAKQADPLLKQFTPLEVTVKSGEPVRQVKLPVAMLKSLFIRAHSHGGQPLLAEARFEGKDGKAIPWDKVRMGQQWGDKHFHGADKPVTLDGRETKNYRRWPNTEAEFLLDGKYETFVAWVGLAEGKKDASITFSFDCASWYALREADAQDRQKTWELVWRDFGQWDKANRVAIADPERILERNWNPGDVKSLASRYAGKCQGDWRTAADKLARAVNTPEDLAKVRDCFYRTLRAKEVQRHLAGFNTEAMLRAINDLGETHPGRYQAAKYRACATAFAERKQALVDGLNAGKDEALTEAETTAATLREAMLANPLFDFEKLLVLKRSFKEGTARHVMGAACGLIGLNAHTNDDIPHTGWDNEAGVLSSLRGTPEYKRLYKTDGAKIMRDLDLEFDGGRIMFSSIGANDRWALFEMRSDGSGLKQLTPPDVPDVDFFDSCYLPDGRIVTASTAGYQGLPCENGGKPMVNLYLFDPERQSIRQLTFEQDSDWHPSVMNDGRVLYLRWEYTDIMHYYSRRLFCMNPDGTSQMDYYGTGSMFPPAFKFARSIPGHPSKVVGVISGHHDFPEHGRLAIIDPRLARTYPFRFRPKTKEWGKEGSYINAIPDVLPAEKTGFVQEIPGYGKEVVGNVCDGIASQAWREGKPQFLHPWPLSEKYFLVSMKRNGDTPWGIYLADIYDNLTLIAEDENAALLQPIPFCQRTRPQAIVDRVKLDCKTADVMITDIYAGPGLKGIPKGKVKSLRVLAYHYAYLGRGGHESVGVESSWDIKRILGTVPVEADGSARFLIPANTPVFVQPLDEEGAALQLMRTWFVGMPGERVSCTGCHETRNSTLPTRFSIAGRKPPSELAPWYGDSRPFAFQFEVFPTVEKFCLGCHDGSPRKDGHKTLSFKDPQTAYNSLHPYCRRPGPESDMEMLPPMEYHGSTSHLVQLLKKGHHGVQPDREAWERLYCWIDLNVPFKGSWTPDSFRNQPQEARRRELAIKYANLDTDPEDEYRKQDAAWKTRKPVPFIAPPPQQPVTPDNLKADGFPMTAESAAALQEKHAKAGVKKTVTLSGEMTMDFALIPPGQFVMGSQDGYPDEQPRAVVTVAKPFWMSVCEVTNGQYEKFDPEHDTRYVHENGKDHSVPGFIANHPDQPVARISWQEAMAFCQWMGQQSGLKATLPTEAQWEWAARAGTATQFYYGDRDTDFSKYANLADRSLRWMKNGFDGGSTIHVRRPYPPEMNFPLHDERFEDKWYVVDYVGQNDPSVWRLKDMIGNVSEWTRSSYRPYPYKEDDGRNSGDVAEKKVARGGSWADRPVDAGASIRYPYESYQKVNDVGFRVILEE